MILVDYESKWKGRPPFAGLVISQDTETVIYWFSARTPEEAAHQLLKRNLKRMRIVRLSTARASLRRTDFRLPERSDANLKPLSAREERLLIGLHLLEHCPEIKKDIHITVADQANYARLGARYAASGRRIQEEK